MVLVAPGIARFTVNGSFVGEEIANVIDMRIDTTGGTVPRSEALFEVAGDILNNWSDHIRNRLAVAYVAQSVSWVDLNTASGDVGVRSSTSTKTWPLAGGQVEASMPPNVAGLVKKQIVGTRGRRSGRMYLCGVPDSWTDGSDPSIIDGPDVTAMNSALALFRSGINDAEGPSVGVIREMVVVHTQRATPTAEPTYNGFTPVQSLTIDTRLATQRRRLRD